MKQVSSVIYKGPSLLDNKPIVVIALISKRNKKTGNMLQTYIIRSDIEPLLASKTGEDFSICGNCPMRGKTTTDPLAKQAKNRACYVTLMHGPLRVWKALKSYPEISGHAAIVAMGEGRMVRLGTYGDPAAVPGYIWESLLLKAKGWTAYTHQSGMAGADVRTDLMMVSADSEQEARVAWNKGERTFRVVASVADIVKGSEILCPASKEAGKKTTCMACGLCAGSAVKAKSIAIPAHGMGAGAFVRKAQQKELFA